MPSQPLPPDGDPAEDPAAAKQAQVPQPSAAADHTDRARTEDALPESSLS